MWHLQLIFLNIKFVVKIRTNAYFNFVCEIILVFCFNSVQFIQHLSVRSILYQHLWAGGSRACGHQPLAEEAVRQNPSPLIGRPDSAS